MSPRGVPFTLFITTEENILDYLSVSLQRPGVDPLAFKSKQLTFLYESNRPITKQKYTDLNYLARNFIPIDGREFYQKLQWLDSNNDDDLGMADLSDIAE